MAHWRIQRIEDPVFNPAAPLGTNSMRIVLEDTDTGNLETQFYNYDPLARPDPHDLMCALQEDYGYTPNDFAVTGCP